MLSLSVHELYTHSLCAVSLLANSLLIAVIFASRKSALVIGRYRHLLLAFAIADLLQSAVHSFVVPCVEMTSFGYIFFSLRTAAWLGWPATLSMLVFVCLFYQSFILLVFHFVYRYLVLRDPPRLFSFTRDLSPSSWVVVVIVVDVVFVGGFLVVAVTLLPCELSRTAFTTLIQEEYGIRLGDGFIGIVYHDHSSSSSPSRLVVSSFVSIGCAFALFAISAATLLLCAFRIVASIASPALSKQTRDMQRQLFLALLLQTLIPLLFSYIPLGLILLIPMFGISLPAGVGAPLIMATALFPAVDPLLILFFVRCFRSSLSSFVRRRLLALFSAAVPLLSTRFYPPFLCLSTRLRIKVEAATAASLDK